MVSNAERRALRSGEKLVVPRVSDIYAALPSITGKLELEYEGELKGADNVVRELIRAAVARAYDQHFHGNANMNQVVQWFDLGGEIQLRDSAGAQEMLQKLRGIQGLLDKLSALGLSGKEPSEVLVSAAEFMLEGLYAHKTISRSEERTLPRARSRPSARSRVASKRTTRYRICEGIGGRSTKAVSRRLSAISLLVLLTAES